MRSGDSGVQAPSSGSLTSRFTTPFVYWLATWVTKFVLLPLYASIRATGLEKVPRKGPFIIVSNHLNDADPGVICTRFSRRVVYMAKIELFQVPGLAQFMRAFGAFPVRRGEADLSAVRRAGETLAAGLPLVVFPEGTRSAAAARLREAWPGAALIALRSDAPILPIAITGSQYLSLPRMFLRLFHRYDVTLTVGEPFYLTKPARVNAASAKAATTEIMQHIAALLPPSYRGYYGDEGVATSDATGD